MRPQKEFMNLECILTDKEKLKYSHELSECLSEKTKAENELKSYAAGKKAVIQNFEGMISEIAEKVRTGKEKRSVECSITYDFEEKVMIWIRTDTYDEVKRDIIPERFLQEELRLQQKKEEDTNGTTGSEETYSTDTVSE